MTLNNRQRAEQRFVGVIVAGFLANSDPIQNLLDDITGITSNLPNNLLDVTQQVFESTMRSMKAEIESSVQEGVRKALSAFSDPDVTKISNTLDSLTQVDNWEPTSVSGAFLDFSAELVATVETEVNKGITLAKELAEIAKAILEMLLIQLAKQIVSDLVQFIDAVSSLLKNTPTSLSNLKDGIINRDPAKVATAFETLMYAQPSALFKQIFELIESQGAGSLTITVDASTAVGVEYTQSIGVAISVDALSYLAKGGKLATYEGAALSFFSVSGFALFSAGSGVDLALGYDFDQPDGVDGQGLDVSLSLDAKVGGSVTVGLDPFAAFPPSVTSISVGVGGGTSVETSIGASYAKIIGTYVPSPADSNPTPESANRLAKLGASSSTVVAPTQQFIQMASNPKVRWLQYQWANMPTDIKTNWETLLGTSDPTGQRVAPSFKDSYGSVFDKNWVSLTVAQQSAATQLGFEQGTWDKSYPNGVSARIETSETAVTDPTAKGYISHVTKYWFQFAWKALGRTEQALLRTLGWDELTFNRFNAAGGGPINPVLKGPQDVSEAPRSGAGYNDLPPSYYKGWNDLPLHQKAAAIRLGYESSSWKTLDPFEAKLAGGATNYARVPFPPKKPIPGPDSAAYTNFGHFATRFRHYAVTIPPEANVFVVYQLVEEVVDMTIDPQILQYHRRLAWELVSANDLNNKRILDVGSRGGTTFGPLPVNSLGIRSGYIVDAVNINGTRYGGSGGGDDETIMLGPTEYIKSIYIETVSLPGHKFDGHIGYLKVITNKGQMLEGGTQNPQNPKTQHNGILAGLCGYKDDYLKSLFVIME